MWAPGELSLIRERATLVAWKRSRKPHWPSYGSLSRIRRRRSVEHFPLLPMVLLGPGTWCSWVHVANRILRAPLLPNSNSMLLLLED